MIVKDESYLRQPSTDVDVLTLTQEQKDGLESIVTEIDKVLVKDSALSKASDVTGYGLSACQLESVKAKGAAPKLCCIRIPGKKPLRLDMLNPQIMAQKHPFSHKGEGCLSFPGKFFTTLRYNLVEVSFVDVHTLQPREFTLVGVEAVTAQHEIDHVDGILVQDRERKPVVAPHKQGSNEVCRCGSGKKFKRCCGEA